MDIFSDSTKFVSICLLSSTRSIVFHSLDRGFRNCAVSMDTCNACFRFRARIIVIYNSRTKGPTTRPSGANQFESTSRHFDNLLEINMIICLKHLIFDGVLNDRNHRGTSQYFGVGAACELR